MQSLNIRSKFKIPRVKSGRLILFLDIVLLIMAVFAVRFLGTTNLVKAQYGQGGYPSGCAACMAAGNWCVENGAGYVCAGTNPAAWGYSCGSRVSASAACPAGCNCGRYEAAAGSTSCSNDCIMVESCGGTPPPNSTPVPTAPPSGSCSSNWCTRPPDSSGASDVCPNGWSWSSDPGFCSDGVHTGRCCAPAGGGGGGTSIPPATCSITLNLNRNPIFTGENTILDSAIVTTDATDVVVNFASNNNSVARVVKTSNSVARVYGDGVGTATITATGSVQGPGGAGTCTATANVTVNAAPWWQVQDGDVISRGDLRSLIPSTCVGTCIPALILRGTGGFPGIPIYGGSNYDFSDSTSSRGTGSEEQNWLVQTNVSPHLETFNFDYFEKLIPPDVRATMAGAANTLGASVTPTQLTTGGTAIRGYRWYRVPSGTSTTINGDVTIPGSEKVIILVEGGNLTINGNITVANPGQGFFMAMVGKDNNGNNGNILTTSASSGSGGGGTTTLVSDDFNRANSATVGSGWTEIEGSPTGLAEISNNTLRLNSTNETARPMVKRTFTKQTTGTMSWTFSFNYNRIGTEAGYFVRMQLGDSAIMNDASPNTAGTAVNLIWTGVSGGMPNEESFGVTTGTNTRTRVATVEGQVNVIIDVDLDNNGYRVRLNGPGVISPASPDALVPFNNNVDIDEIRIFNDSLTDTSHSGRQFDNMVLTATAPVTPGGTTRVLHGLYLSEGQFQTGTTGAQNDTRFQLRGSVAALGGLLLQRNLGATPNRTLPAEFFEYAPEMLVPFPREFKRDRIIWQELAP